MDMAKKFLLMMCMVLLIGSVSAFDWTDTYLYYPLNESSGNAVDVAGGNTGIASSVLYGVAGKIGTAYNFDKTNYITLTTPKSFASTNDFTISFWYKGNDTNVAGQTNTIAGWDSGDVYAQLGLSGGKFAYAHYYGGWNLRVSTTTVADNNWHHLVFVNWANQSGVLYVDGVAETYATTHITTNNYFRTSTLMQGYGADANGTIDEFAIFSKSLANNEVVELYNSGNGLAYNSNVEVDITNPIVTLVSPTDKTNSSTISNIFNCSASDNIGITSVSLYGNFSGNWLQNITNTSGFNNSIYSFTTNLPDGNYIWNCKANDSAGNNGWGSSNYSFTVDTTPPFANIVFPANTTYTYNVSTLNYTYSDLHLSSCWFTTNIGVTNVSVSCGTNVTDLTSLEGSNTWTMWANDTFGNVNSSSVTFTKDTVPPMINITYPINTTYENNVTNMSYTSDGVNTWYSLDGGATNTTVTCVGSLYNNTLGYYKFDETSGTNVEEFIAQKNLTDINTPSQVTGIINNGLNFTGGSSQFAFGNLNHYYALDGNAWSISAWVYPYSVTGNNMIAISNGNWNLRLGADLVFFGAISNISSAWNNDQYAGDISLTPLNWYHILITYNGSVSGVKIYVNGVLGTIGGNWQEGSIPKDIGDGSFRIGGDNDSNDYAGAYFDGTIDEFGIWNRELTSSEITQLYNSGIGLSYSTPASDCSITGLASKQGSNTWTMWANDTFGNLNSSSVTFSVAGIEEPVTINVLPVSAITLNGGTTKDAYVLFNSSSANVDETSAQVILTNGAVERISSGCTNVSTEFNCTITFNFYDEAGVWNINASIIDNSANLITNTSETATINALDYVTQDVNYFAWSGALSLGVDNQEASNTITLTNGGNQDYATLNIKGQNATGVVYANVITADKFSIDNVASSILGIHLEDNTDVDMSSILNLNSHGASVTEVIYAYVDVPLGIKADNYLSSTAWGINLQ